MFASLVLEAMEPMVLVMQLVALLMVVHLKDFSNKASY